MKAHALVFILFLTLKLSAQYDTSLLGIALDYIKTDQFKTELKDFTNEAIKKETAALPNDRSLIKKYKDQRLEFTKFWLGDKCFMSDTVYRIPVLSSRVKHAADSLRFREFDTLFYRPSQTNCQTGFLVELFFLSPGIIELIHFSGTKGRMTLYGESYILRLEITGNKPRILAQYHIFHN